jgi:hypothetical protein
MPKQFAMSRKEVAKKMGLSFQEVRWAEESAIKKIRQSRAEIESRIEALVWDGTHGAARQTEQPRDGKA